MKTLPGGIPLTADVTLPVYLLQMQFPVTGIVRYSSRETITINSNTYLTSGIVVRRLDTDANGTMHCSIDFPAQDGAITSVVLSESFAGSPANVWMVYGPGPAWTDADRVHVFEGVIDAAPTISADLVTLDFISEADSVLFSPRHRAGPPWNNFIPPPGAKITWGDEEFTLPGF